MLMACHFTPDWKIVKKINILMNTVPVL